MKKDKNTEYVCQSCGNRQVKWSGKCPSCGSWNSLQEERKQLESSGTANRYAMVKTSGEIFDLSDVETIEFDRIKTSIDELDTVLGGGLVEGSVILIGGEPGIGKSTLLIQVSEKINKLNQKVLYISGEESLQQIALRAKRLELNTKGIKIHSETELEKIIDSIDREKPKFVIIDSIQTMFTNQLSSAPGSVSQIKDCAARLTRYAKENNVIVVLVGHVTKEGDLAGPRVLEHTVDTVLYFEGEKDSTIRILRAFKNRFGSVNEIGVFSMAGKGLEEIRDLGMLFVANQSSVPGSCLFMTQEGNKPILIEIQALVDKTTANIPIKSAVGFDQKRLSMIMAISNKFLKMQLYMDNVFVSLIGGIKTQDSTVDLPILLSLVASHRDKPLPNKMMAFGEIGLTGELRNNYNFETRIKEASRLGIETIIMPKIEPIKKKELEKKYSITIEDKKDVLEVVQYLKNNVF